MDDSERKQHRKRKAGPKAEKKKAKKSQDGGKQRNPKAFAVQSVQKTQKRVHRTLDIETKKHHIPLVDKTPDVPAPIVVGIVGPPKVGKTTLLRGLVKNFTRQKLNNPKGPITVVSGKHKRLTFIECNNDINSMIDIAKISDLVLLVVDAGAGFEQDMFEFLAIAKQHGMPRIISVLTHLDTFKDNKKMKRTKKRLKHRLWTEIYDGAKMFYITGLQYNDYNKRDVFNLGRFISVTKFRPMPWRQNHPYVLADRLEDLTDPELLRQNKQTDRKLCLYGYLRGSMMRNEAAVHIPGVGDHKVSDIIYLPDPCPLPGEEKKRSLNQKERLLYAPFSGVGGVMYDKDAVYIDLGGSHSHKSDSAEPTNTEEKMLAQLKDTQGTLDEKMDSGAVQLFSGGPLLRDSGFSQQLSGQNSDSSDDDDKDDSDDSDDDSDEQNQAKRHKKNPNEEFSGDVIYEDTDSEEDGMNGSGDEEDEGDDSEAVSDTSEDEENETERWRRDLLEKASTSFQMRQKQKVNWDKLIYGRNEPSFVASSDSGEASDEDDVLGGLLKKSKRRRTAGNDPDQDEESCCSRGGGAAKLDEDELVELVSLLTVTGDWGDQDAEKRLAAADEAENSDDSSVYGDFEDLETGEKFSGNNQPEDGTDGGSSDDEESEQEESASEKKKTKKEMTANERRALKKAKLKASFDAEYDRAGGNEGKSYFDEWKEETKQQAELNRTAFADLDDSERVRLEGMRPGMYVRVELNAIPCEMVENFDPTYPVIIGGVAPGEENAAYVHVRFLKHRWYKGVDLTKKGITRTARDTVLKNRNPLIFSIGWRRFQTVPVFSMRDDNGRQRMLKYTPQHLYCHASFWGPKTPPNTGVVAFETVNNAREFRICGTGVVLDQDQSFTVVKKLKLTGTPAKIFNKSCFIKGMFNSKLEVAKMEGSAIQTVSGIRGIIKKSLHGEDLPAGAFRATFEDKILSSDIVFVKTWWDVEIPKIYTPVSSLLLEDKKSWNYLKSVGQLRHERGVAVPHNTDSIYKPVVRSQRKFNPLVIPKDLQKSLPFKDKPKKKAEADGDPLDAIRPKLIEQPEETRLRNLMKMVRTNYKEKMRSRHREMRQRAAAYEKRLAKDNELRDKKLREAKKELFRVLGKMQKSRSKKS